MKRICLIIAIILLPYHVLANSFNRIPILMYHHILVSDRLRGAIKDLSVSPELFKEHLDLIQKLGYKTITFKDVMSGDIPEKPIIITFDDATKSQWSAYEELSRRGMKAVFFVIVKDIGNRGSLSVNQLEKIKSSGMEIGSHTLTHPDLPRIKWIKAVKEITQSKKELEDKFATSIISFAYPYGRVTKKLMSAVEDAGYQYGRSTDERIARFGSEKNFNLPIIYIHHYTTNTKLERLLDDKR